MLIKCTFMAVSVHFIKYFAYLCIRIKNKKIKDYEDFKRNERIG